MSIPSRVRSSFARHVLQASRVTPVVAKQPTPAAESLLHLPEGERSHTMFVQTAQAGTWAPSEQEEGVYTLSLTGLPAQTVYFSDRPERIVGTQSTADFLDALGFGADFAPNAALVTTDGAGNSDVLVIELFDPVYTEDGRAGATLVYQARILENYHETGLGRVALQQDDTSIPATFAGASLFIDDCLDGAIDCLREGKLVGRATWGCCYKFPACTSCHGERPPYLPICQQLPECADGKCGATWWRTCGPVH